MYSRLFSPPRTACPCYLLLIAQEPVGLFFQLSRCLPDLTITAC
uniref:Uncharacterized protein n=1 Tax=Anguilla anguilla TaxID=7936 RepID=A0A0E9PQB6_ANGAN